MNEVRNNPVADFFWRVRAKAVQRTEGAAMTERWLTANRAPASVIKAAVGGNLSEDLGGEARSAIAGFHDALANDSAFLRLLRDNAFMRTPLRKRIGVVTAGGVGHSPGDGKPILLSRLTMNMGNLQPRHATALITMSDDLIRDASSAGQALFAKILRRAVADEVDREFIDAIVDTSTLEITSSGNDEDSALIDIRTLLQAVSSTGSPSLYFVSAPNVAKSLACFPETFPNCSPTGGTIVNTPLIVSHAIEQGMLMLINGGNISADALETTVSVSNEATIEMSDGPGMDATAGTAPAASVSMFQTNMVAMKALSIFGAERLTTDAVAIVTGAVYGETSATA